MGGSISLSGEKVTMLMEQDLINLICQWGAALIDEIHKPSVLPVRLSSSVTRQSVPEPASESPDYS